MMFLQNTENKNSQTCSDIVFFPNLPKLHFLYIRNKIELFRINSVLKCQYQEFEWWILHLNVLWHS